jgi:hypothetical protein
MILVAVTIVLVAAAVIALAVTHRRSARLLPMRGDDAVIGFAVWLGAGFLVTGALLTLLSIGLLLVPLAVVAVFLAVQRFSVGIPTLGAVAGAGFALVGIGISNVGSRACTSGSFELGPGQLGSISCGGPSPTPFLVVGAGSVLFAIVVAVVFERQRRKSVRPPGGRQGAGAS